MRTEQFGTKAKYVLLTDHEAKLASLPSQEQIDAVAVGLADLAMIERGLLARYYAKHGMSAVPPKYPTPRAYILLLTLLGIPTDAEWAPGVLETHHDGAVELVEALRDMKAGIIPFGLLGRS